MFASRYKKIGAKIVFYRKLKSMTQEKLAEEVGITPQYLSRIENGGYTKSVSLSTLMKIAEKLGDRKSTRLNSSHIQKSRMPSSA